MYGLLFLISCLFIFMLSAFHCFLDNQTREAFRRSLPPFPAFRRGPVRTISSFTPSQPGKKLSKLIILYLHTRWFFKGVGWEGEKLQGREGERKMMPLTFPAIMIKIPSEIPAKWVNFYFKL